jgi:hypothetical protein
MRFLCLTYKKGLKFDVSVSLTYKKLGFLDIDDLKILENEGILRKAPKKKPIVYCAHEQLNILQNP